MLQLPALLSLISHAPCDAAEASFRRQIISFVSGNTDFASRNCAAGHVTASGWVLDASGTHALLIHHAKLDRWLQPGGHVEDNDASLAAAALREVMEETGLQRLSLASRTPYDIDVHAIPARGSDPAHMHYDCRFLFHAERHATVNISDESTSFQWVPISELTAKDVAPGLRRMACKSLAPARRNLRSR
jgi:8-oxo-dGTP pyrophosphatase MutT (NUDIX family)